LPMAYGHNGNLADADLASAQAAFARGDNKTARELAARAKMRFPVGSPGWVRADDIVAFKKGTIDMTIKSRIAFAAAVSLALAGAAPAVAQSFSADQREEIGKIIKDYLL